MKLFLILAITIVLSINLINAKPKAGNEDKSPEMIAAQKVCIDKFKIGKKDFQTNGKNKKNEVSHDWQCYIDCMVNELGAVKDGVVQDDKVIADLVQRSDGKITKEEAAKMVTTCKNQVAQLKNTDKCVNSYTFKECLKSNKQTEGPKSGKKGGKV